MTSTQLPSQPTAYAHFIDGKSVVGSVGGGIERRSPGHTATVVSTYGEGTTDDARAAIAAARKAFDDGPWPHSSGAERQSVLLRVAALIRAHKEELALVECLESGKPISQACDEMDWAAGIWDYAAALARHLHGETTNTLGPSLLGLTLREPVGVCALITPWNFPLLIISQKLPFALAAGCTCVVKPSEFTSGTTVRLAALLKEAGLPDGVCNVVTGHGDPVGETFVTSPHVDMVSFTGSTAVGRRIAEKAGATLKKVSLELGGKNPQLIFADADLDAVVDAVVHGVFFNMGECCNSGSRILVEEAVADDLVEKIIAASRSIRMGDPLDPAVKVGAIINEAQQRKILGYIQEARSEGASVPLGGGAVDSSGLFVELTVLDKVRPEMRVASGEVFGPVLTVLRFTTEEEALSIANGTDYGLSASVWTRDFDRALRLSRRIAAGTVWINTFLDGAPELPFGGYKQSGLGRELGPHSVLDFTETKTVTMRLGPYQNKWL
jgi:acyl-CoA reductase-like NAD-dependent aldehyde dehydrogenase